MAKFLIENFGSGIVNDVEEQSIPESAASSSLNWVTYSDRIELRRGYAILGNRVSGTGKITGLRVPRQADGTEIPFRARGQKVESYDSDNDEWDELGSNVLGSDADGEDIAMDSYHSQSGAQMFISSVNSDVFKVLVANRESIVDLNSTNYKGKIKITQNRMFMWDRKNSNGIGDETGLHLSYIDNEQYTTVSGESIGTGDASTKTFAGTLSAISGVKTAFAVTITDGTETFIDDRNGTLVGDQGGTGTINYATGAFSVTFNSAPADSQDITADYRHEDPTNQGIVDFSFSTPRTAGEGDTFRQDSGGRLQNVLVLSHNNKDFQFCMHEKNTWLVELTDDDTGARNYVYREKVGIPYWLAAKETSIGIVYVDDVDEQKARIKVLRVEQGTESKVEPVSISNNIDLTDYRFDQAVIHEWGDYIIIVCRHKDSTINNRTWLYNKRFSDPGSGREVWDLVDYYASRLENYNGALIAGDPIQNNVWTLFSGTDDDGSEIPNHWEGKLTKQQIDALKRLKKLVVQGAIGPNQSIKVSLSVDRGNFVEIGTIDGDAAYVDKTNVATVGSSTLGRSEVGGGSTVSGGITAYNYVREFEWDDLDIDEYEEIKIRFSATKIGYASISKILYEDIRVKSEKTVPLKYRS